jgi:hypothetical protein
MDKEHTKGTNKESKLQPPKRRKLQPLSNQHNVSFTNLNSPNNESTPRTPLKDMTNLIPTNLESTDGTTNNRTRSQLHTKPSSSQSQVNKSKKATNIQSLGVNLFNRFGEPSQPTFRSNPSYFLLGKRSNLNTQTSTSQSIGTTSKQATNFQTEGINTFNRFGGTSQQIGRSNPSEVVLGKRKFHSASFNTKSVPIHLTDDQPTDTSDNEEDLDNFDEGIDGSSSDSDNDAGEPSLFEGNSLGAFDYFLTVSLVIFRQIVTSLNIT